MHKIARAFEALGRQLGVVYRYGAEVAEVSAELGRASGVRLASGEHIVADAVVLNADPSPVAAGRLGRKAASSTRRVPPRRRSLSALTLAFQAEASGLPLARHTVFFPAAPYNLEFDAIFRQRKLPPAPTVYLCAQDRDGRGDRSEDGAERFLTVVNAPALLNGSGLSLAEIEECETKTFRLMETCGLTLRPLPGALVRAAPQDFETLLPGTGGAIYGRASHGWMASFQRQGTRSTMPGLYFAGGSVHPGPGIPMAALSGALASEALLADLGLPRLLSRMATPGGMSMRSAQTIATD
jgi:1-hydroxycarotenoid 3,4-desaturase